MITLIPKAIIQEDFAQYGTFYDLCSDTNDVEIVRSSGNGYTDGYTKKPLIDGLGSFGMTCVCAAPCVIRKMERHLHTQEAMMCAGTSIAFLVAVAGGGSPKSESVKAFILNSGQVVVLNRGVWHSPAVGMSGPAEYYWMAEAYDEEPTFWAEIEGESVEMADFLAEE